MVTKAAIPVCHYYEHELVLLLGIIQFVLAKNAFLFDQNFAYIYCLIDRVYTCGSPFRLILNVCFSSVPLQENVHLFVAAYNYISGPSHRVVIVADHISSTFTIITAL